MDYRTEYPRPQLVRENWLCLNGEWEFEIDRAEVGIDYEFQNRERLNGRILVPFAPESDLSGVGEKDFIGCVWYRKVFALPAAFAGKRVILHFGAVDYASTVFVNGLTVGTHRGGYTPFSFDITDVLQEGENVIVLCATDHERSFAQPIGKQSHRAFSSGCRYTRTTGIWQTVWLEAVHPAHTVSYRVYPDVSNGQVTLVFTLSAAAAGKTLTAQASFEGKNVGTATARVLSNSTTLTIDLTETHLWEIGCGRLYDLTVTLADGTEVCDKFDGYFGLREVGLTERGMTLNGKLFFGRYVLDQGYYPDGVYTAPSDEALKNDILFSLALGFNGARLHQKLFEPRFLYWADKLGYLVWGEYASWGLRMIDAGAAVTFLPEWLEAVERDFNHPSLIGWCPFNEVWNDWHTGARPSFDAIRTVYLATKATDPTRPIVDVSGGFHVQTDLFDCHDYTADPAVMKENYAHLAEGKINDYVSRTYPKQQTYAGTTVFVSEYGGIKWGGAAAAWGYGKNVTTQEEFVARYRGLTDVLLDNELICAFCYTQLYDVEQECNGLMTYDRTFKFPPDIFREINSRKAKIEE